MCCPGANLGLFFEVKGPGLKRGHLLAVYEGDSCDSLGISYKQAVVKWKDSEYVLSHSHHRFVVNGALTSGAARGNDSFGDANTLMQRRGGWS